MYDMDYLCPLVCVQCGPTSSATPRRPCPRWSGGGRIWDQNWRTHSAPCPHVHPLPPQSLAAYKQ